MLGLVLGIRTLAAAAFAALLACGRPLASLDDEAVGEASSSSSEESSSEESTSEESTTDEPLSSDEDPTFVQEYDIPLASNCDPFEQDCPPGEKCVPYASDGGNVWNANKCVPVMGDQHSGETCTWNGIVEATDDCDATSICWDVMDVDGELIGVCHAMCTGSADDPECPPGSSCIISSESSINVCIFNCDPVLQDCGEGLACFWANTGFSCIFTTQDIPTGQPCGFINDCAEGNFCVDAAALPDCVGSACCTNFCDHNLGDAQCAALPGTSCLPFFELGMAPPGYEDVGICELP